MTYEVFNRVCTDGLFLGSVYFPSTTGGQYDTHSFTTLDAFRFICKGDEKPFEHLEQLCLAQEFAADLGFSMPCTQYQLHLNFYKGNKND